MPWSERDETPDLDNEDLHLETLFNPLCADAPAAGGEPDHHYDSSDTSVSDDDCDDEDDEYIVANNDNLPGRHHPRRIKTRPRHLDDFECDF